MKPIVLDQGLAPDAALALRQHGIDALHVSEIGLGRAEDADILGWARENDRICVTLDHDFHAHLALTGEGRPSVVLLRVQGLNSQAQAELIRVVLVRCEDSLSVGAVVSADGESIRVRRLPLE